MQNKLVLTIILVMLSMGCTIAQSGNGLNKSSPMNAGEKFGISRWVEDRLNSTPGVQQPSWVGFVSNNTMHFMVHCSGPNEFQTVQYCGAYYAITLRTYPNVGDLEIVLIADHTAHMYHYYRQWVDDSQLSDTAYLNAMGETLAGTRDSLG